MKTFDELRQQAEAIRDAVNENENSAARVGGHLLDTIVKMESLDIADVAEAVLEAEAAAAEAKKQADIASQSGEIAQKAKEQGEIAEQKGNEAVATANAAAERANAAADKAINEGLFKTPQDLSEEEQAQVQRNIGVADLELGFITLPIEGLEATVNATTLTVDVPDVVPKEADFIVVDLGSEDSRDTPRAATMSVILSKVTDGGRVRMEGYLKTSHEEYVVKVTTGATQKDRMSVGLTTDIETTFKVFQIRYLAAADNKPFKGSFADVGKLSSAYPIAKVGDYAFVGNPRHLFVWSGSAWSDRGEYVTGVDQALDARSIKPIANKAVTARFAELDDTVKGIQTEISGVSSALDDLSQIEL